MINKTKIIENIKNKEDRILIANIIDKYENFLKTKTNKIIGFLDEREIILINNILKFLKVNYYTYKYSDACEKSIISFLEIDKYEALKLIEIKFNNNAILHRDILGTLFSLGIKQELIGDIFVLENKAYIVSINSYLDIITNDLLQIKNIKVHPIVLKEIIDLNKNFEILTLIIPSMRLDIIISKITHLARNKASIYIIKKNVLINYQEETSPSKTTKLGDILSISGYGKYIIYEIINKTKSDNIVLQIKQYK